MSERDFWDCELREVFNRIAGFQQMEQNRLRSEWEQTRWLATVVMSMFAKPGKRIKPTDLATFPWDEAAKEKKVKPLSDEERRAKFERLDKKIHKLIEQHQKQKRGE